MTDLAAMAEQMARLTEQVTALSILNEALTRKVNALTALADREAEAELVQATLDRDWKRVRAIRKQKQRREAAA